jgi:hypothetical protein
MFLAQPKPGGAACQEAQPGRGWQEEKG